MNRAERRPFERVVNKLSSKDKTIVENYMQKMLEEKLSSQASWLAKLVDKTVFKAMREYKISEKRAVKVLNRAGEMFSEMEV